MNSLQLCINQNYLHMGKWMKILIDMLLLLCNSGGDENAFYFGKHQFLKFLWQCVYISND